MNDSGPLDSLVKYINGSADVWSHTSNKYMLISREAKCLVVELRQEISYNVVCATSKGSDQHVHTHSLIRSFASRLNNL